MQRRYKITISVLCLLLLCFVGVGVWYWFNNVKDDDCIINDNKYSFLNDYFVGKENGICKYKVKGIIYNVDSENKSYDFNLWDIKDKKSLYYEELDIVSEVNDMSLFKEYSAVDVSYGFRDGDLDNMSLSKAVLSEAEYMDAFKKVFTVVNGDYSRYVEIEGYDYPDDFPSLIRVRNDGSIINEPSIAGTTMLQKLNAITMLEEFDLLAKVSGSSTAFDISDYLIEISSYIEHEKISYLPLGDDFWFMHGCSLSKEILERGILSEEEKLLLLNIYCPYGKVSNVIIPSFESDGYNITSYTFESLKDYYGQYPIDYLYSSRFWSNYFSYLPDSFADFSIHDYGYIMTNEDITKVENLVAGVVMNDPSMLSTICPLIYDLSLTLKSVTDEDYADLYDVLLLMVEDAYSLYLLQELEENVDIALQCFDGFGIEEEVLNDLVYSNFIKYYYFNLNDIYYDGVVYSGLWEYGNSYVIMSDTRYDPDVVVSSSVDNIGALQINNNVRYLSLLLKYYEENY